MEHEVYVPFSVGSVREALAGRERVARCVPGLQLDAASGGGDSLAGRLRVRIGGSTITYRGSVTLVPEGDGFTVEGSGTEARGSGSAELSLTLVPRVAADGEGTRLICSGTVVGEGRIADHDGKAAASAGKRLLDRFSASLAESLRTEVAPAPAPEGAPQDASTAADDAEAADGHGPAARIDARQAAGLGEPDDNDRAIPGIPNPEKGERDRDPGRDEAGEKDAPPGDDDAETGASSSAEGTRDAQRAGAEEGEGDAHVEWPASQPDEETTGGIFETEIPPPSLDPLDPLGPFGQEGDGGEVPPEDAASEAAHARRTMIGRSAEEVDHAPPRGRYAPVPAHASPSAGDTLRWAAPAAAAVLAGAVVLTRALRRRH